MYKEYPSANPLNVSKKRTLIPEVLEKVLKKKNRWIFWGHGRTLRIFLNGVKYCPLTYAAFIITRNHFDIDDYRAAARAIGISKSVAERIANAADAEGRKKTREELIKMIM